MYIIRAIAHDTNDRDRARVYVANTARTDGEVFTMNQRDAMRYETKDDARVASLPGFLIVKLTRRNR